MPRYWSKSAWTHAFIDLELWMYTGLLNVWKKPLSKALYVRTNPVNEPICSISYNLAAFFVQGSSVLMKCHVEYPSQLHFFLTPSVQPLLRQRQYFTERGRGGAKLEKRLWIPIQTSAFRFSVHGIQTSVLDFCQPVMTLAVLTFPCRAVSHWQRNTMKR